MDFNKIFEGLGFQPGIEPILLSVSSKRTVYHFNESSIFFEGTKEYKLPIGALLIEIANVDKVCGFDALQSLIISVASRYTNYCETLCVDLYKSFREYFTPITARIIVMLFYAYLNTGQNTSISTSKAIISFSELCNYYINGGELQFPNNRDLNFTAYLIPHNKKFIMFLETTKAQNIILYDLFKSTEQHIRPKRCKMCGKAFSPATRSDEIYCKNIYRNNRTCADVAFEIKSKENPFYTEYRKAYKTMSARLSRMIGLTAQTRKMKLDRWREEATKKREEFEDLNDISGYRVWIEESKLQ